MAHNFKNTHPSYIDEFKFFNGDDPRLLSWWDELGLKFPYCCIFIHAPHDEIEQWCSENFEEDFYFNGKGMVYCKNDVDLMAVKLMWA